MCSFCIVILLSFKKVEGCSSGESSLSLELSTRRRLSAEEEMCAGRPAPEGAGAVSVSESDRDETRPDLCKQCQMTVAELRRQALALSDPASLKVSERKALLGCHCKVHPRHFFLLIKLSFEDLFWLMQKWMTKKLLLVSRSTWLSPELQSYGSCSLCHILSLCSFHSIVKASHKSDAMQWMPLKGHFCVKSEKLTQISPVFLVLWPSYQKTDILFRLLFTKFTQSSEG